VDRHCFDAIPDPDPDLDRHQMEIWNWIGIKMEVWTRIGIKRMPIHNTVLLLNGTMLDFTKT
jgi:hypothetical protein